MKWRIYISILALATFGQAHAQNDQNTFQTINIERADQPGVYMTLNPPSAPIVPYTLHLPDRPPESGQELIAIGTNPIQLNWMYSATAVMEIVDPLTYNVRRKKIAHQDSTTIGTPGYASYDFMGARTSPTQTAAGNYSLILGGRNNRTGDTATVVAGGLSNVSEEYWSLIIGGSNNYQTGDGWRSGIMGGYSNQATGYEHTIMGGYDNDITTELWRQSIMGGYQNVTGATRATIIGGYQNEVTGDDATVLCGLLNDVTGDESLVMGGKGNIVVTSNSNDRPGTIGGGEANEVRASYATVLGGYDNVVSGTYATSVGGRKSTITSAGGDSFIFNGSDRSISLTTPDQFVVNNATLWMANNSGTPTGVLFFEAYSSSGTFPSTVNWVQLVAPTSTLNGINTTYTLPDQIPTTIQGVLGVASSPAPSTTEATLSWQDVLTNSVVSVSATNSTTTISASSLNPETFVKVNPSSSPSNRTLRLSDGTVDGAVVYIRVYGSQSSRGVRMFDSDANLNLAGTGSVDLTRFDTITLVWDGTSSEWIEVGRSDN